jgi:hypothetical protein
LKELSNDGDKEEEEAERGNRKRIQAGGSSRRSVRGKEYMRLGKRFLRDRASL